MMKFCDMKENARPEAEAFLSRQTALMYSVILPAYNEGENLPLLIPEIVSVCNALEGDFEILLVDDGSTDKSPDIIRSLQEKFSCLRSLRLKRNYGLSTALKAGYEASQGLILITMDSDLQYSPNEIPRFLSLLDHYDLVCGYRSDRYDSWIKKGSSFIANRIRNRIAHEAIRDAGCIFRVFPRSALDQIPLFDGFHRFLPTLFKMKGFSVGQIRVAHQPRKFGKSKFGLLNRILPTSIDMLGVLWMQRRRISYEIDDKK